MLKQWLSKKITRGYLDKFIQQQQTSQKTLDLGASDSPYASYFPNRVGCDIKKGEGVDVIADAHKLPFADAEFDVILCTEVLEHLHSPHVAIAEMRRVLKPKGKLILTTRFVFPIHDAPDDYYRYTEFGLRYLFREKWQIVSIRPETRNFENISVLLQRIAYQTNLRGGYFTKGILLLIAKFVKKLGWLCIRENGINSSINTYNCNIFASGYYLIATKN